MYTDGSKLYSISAKWIVAAPIWEANRVMDEKHVEDLEKSITNPKEIQGLFSVVEFVDEDTKKPIRKIIDGQHRREVLRRYFERVPDAPDFKVLTRRYQINEHDDAVSIFQKINHAKPMVYRGSPSERLHECVRALTRQFLSEKTNGSLIQLIRPGCNRPFLNTANLEDALKRYKVIDNDMITPQKVVEHAIHMNAFYAEDINRLAGIRVTKHTMERAIECGFYLGLDPNCVWLLPLL